MAAVTLTPLQRVRQSADASRLRKFTRTEQGEVQAVDYDVNVDGLVLGEVRSPVPPVSLVPLQHPTR